MSKFVPYWGTRRERPCTCLGDVAELESRCLSSFDAAMPADYFYRKLPRKWWEWEYIAECAEVLNLLRPDATALGLGAGGEPLIFHFARKCGRVIATDLYSSDSAWNEARFKTTYQLLDSSPISFPRDHVEVRNADMRHTAAEAESVDFVWSCSSIEHVPTLQNLFQVFAEIDRILKLGGHAILTTEFCVSANPYLLPGVNAWNQEIFDAIQSALRGFEFIGPTDLSFNSLHPGNAAHPRRYLPISSLPASSPHLSYYHRAGCLANPVGLSIIVPIAFVLRKISRAGVTNWEEVAIPGQLRTYSEGLAAYFDGRNKDAIDKLDEVYCTSDNDLQLRHLAFRFLIDAKARSDHMEQRDKFADTIEGFLQSTPDGPVQDADALDICAYLLGECGRIERALEIYKKCLASPSTSLDHVFELLGRYLALANKHSSKSASTELAASVIADLVQFGLTGSDLRKRVDLLSSKVGDNAIGDVMKHARQCIERSINAIAL